MSVDTREFWQLREAPLHTFGAADWEAYYPRMAAWLVHEDEAVRGGAVERLATAVFWSEPGDRSEGRDERAIARARWMLDRLEAAQARRPDVIALFLGCLRWKGEGDPFGTVLLPWLDALRTRPRPDVPADRVEGAFVLHGGYGADPETGERHWLALLDHESNYVRSCAARMLGERCAWDETQADAPLVATIKAKEIARPGIAGAFWTGWDPDLGRLAFDPVAWMLDIVESRDGPEPDDMAFNGIDFHLHELAGDSAAIVRRLIDGGRHRLAVQTATEMHGEIEGMRENLFELGANTDAEIALHAQQHLAIYYNALHPNADPARIRHHPGWRPALDAFGLRQGEGRYRRDCVVLHPVGAPIGDAEAWAAIDAVLDPARRGAIARHILALHDDPPGPYRLGDGEHWQFAGGARVTLNGDPDKRVWRLIDIIGQGLGQGPWPAAGQNSSATS